MRSSLRCALWTLAVCLAVLGNGPASSATQAGDTIGAARDLYSAAAYEEALAILDRLAEAPAASDRERATIDHYRALCLLALNRPDDANAAAEAMVRHDPLYSPPAEELSPRTRQLFQGVQRRILPTVAQEHYARARSAYEEGRSREAVTQFDRLIEILDAVDAAGNGPPLTNDLRVLATGFRELASAAARPPAPPSAAASTEIPRTPTPPSPQENTVATPPRAALVVTPPVTIRQEVPQWPRDLPFPQQAVAIIEVVIGRDGRVQQARLQTALHPRYDQLLLAAARNWTYRPARRDGQPTPFVKAVRIELLPQR